MDLHVLEYFLMVAEEGNITRAAELLHVSQPTVSRQLMDLEAQLHKTLFVRTRKNVRLTPDGLLFRETAREMLALYRKALRWDESAQALVGEIYLGMGETGSVSFLAQQIARFRRENPGVGFHLISENADRIAEDIEKGVLDAGFVMRRVDPAAFEILDLGLEETWGVLLPGDHPLAGEPQLRPQQLRGERLILPENTVFKSELVRFLGREEEQRADAAYNLVANALELARAAHEGVVCLGVPGEAQAGWTFVPFTPRRTAAASLIWKKRPVQPPAVEAFLRQIRDTVSE